MGETLKNKKKFNAQQKTKIGLNKSRMKSKKNRKPCTVGVFFWREDASQKKIVYLPQTKEKTTKPEKKTFLVFWN